MMRALVLAALLMGVAACSPPAAPSGEVATAEPTQAPAPATAAPAQADASAVPAASFKAREPSEIGVQAAPTIWQAIAPLAQNTPEGVEGKQELRVTIKRGANGYVADVVDDGLLDDSVATEHHRIEFRREPEGWFPTNAYSRWICRRGDNAGQWTTEACL
jgi:hypothetical protein